MTCRLIFALLIFSLSPFAVAGDLLRLTSTTSTQDSGLLDILLPAFEQASGYRTMVFAVGTGAALRMGREGYADVLLVHAPEAERRFVDEGHGLARYSIMHNDFVIVGPPSDPAGLSGVDDAVQALQQVWDRRALFLSRGDDSGTHKKELRLWSAAELDPYGARWYRELGMNMAHVLRAASEQGAYTLTDRGTWLALRQGLDLEVLASGDPLMRNPYTVIEVNPDRHPSVNTAAARAFIEWICSPAAQRLIGDYRKNGEVLFTPDLPTE